MYAILQFCISKFVAFLEIFNIPFLDSSFTILELFLGTLLFHGINFFMQGKLQNKAFALTYVNDLLKNSRSKTDMTSFQSVMSMILGEEEGESLAKKVFKKR